MRMDEFESFIAALLAMMAKPQVKLQHYWSDDLFLQNKFIKTIITRDMFLQIFRALTFYDVEDSDNDMDLDV